MIVTMPSTSTKSNFVDAIRFGWCNFFLRFWVENPKKHDFWAKIWNFLFIMVIYRGAGFKDLITKHFLAFPPDHLDQWLIFWKSPKIRILSNFKKYSKYSAARFESHLWSQYGSYDHDTRDLWIRAIFDVPKIFVCQNTRFCQKSSDLDFRILRNPSKSWFWAWNQQAHVWLHRTPNSILSPDSDQVTNFAHFKSWELFCQKYLVKTTFCFKVLVEKAFFLKINFSYICL